MVCDMATRCASTAARSLPRSGRDFGMRFTGRTIAAIPSAERGQRLYTDDTIPGFRLCVGATVKAFVLAVGEDRRRIAVGRYPIVSLAQAREKANSILAQRQLGLDHQPTPFF